MRDKKKVYTTGEVATICGVTLRTVVNWIQRGELEAYKLPGKRGDNRITEGNLIDFFVKNKLPIPDAFEEIRPSGHKLPKALVVDDDPPMARAIARLMKQNGFDIVIANDGFEAGFQFKKFEPDIVTLDLNMPKMDGMSVLSKLKSDSSSVKVMVISGEGELELQRALDAGADAVFAKPFDQVELVKKASELIGKKNDC